MEVLVPRGNTKAPIIIVDEDAFKERMKMDKREYEEKLKELQESCEVLKEIVEGDPNDYAPIEPDKNKINKYDRFLQNKKNKQQFKSQKFNPKVATKFNGKNNMNLRRGGGR